MGAGVCHDGCMRRGLVVLAALSFALGCSSTPDAGDGSAAPEGGGEGGGDGDGSADDGSGGDDGASDTGPVDSGVCTASPHATGTTMRKAKGGTYYSYVPSGYKQGTPWPLVVALHGAGDTAQNYLAALWKSNADAKGLIVIVPEGTAPLGNGYTWNTGDRTTILAAQDDVARCYDLVPKKVILQGFSAGGIMAYWIGLKDALRFSGVGIDSADLGSAEAAGNGGNSLLPAPWKIPVSHFHGDQDMNFPIMYAQQGITRLMNAGHPTFWHPFSGGHTANAMMTAQEYEDLKGYSAP